MKILMVSSLYGNSGGGAGLIAQYIADGLSNLGHQISVVTIGDVSARSSIQQNDVRILRFKPANLYPFKEKDLHPAWQRMIWQLVDMYNLQCARMFREILRKESPDIIH